MAGLISVAEALARILATAPQPLESGHVPLAQALGRTLAADLAARRTQPPADLSAMDGYAVRAADLHEGATLTLVGQSAAGHGFDGIVGQGQAVRIFTGARVPAGADTILMQENTQAAEGTVTALQSEPSGRHVRRAGLDFEAGQVMLEKGRRLDPQALALAAAMNHARLPVTRMPRVAILATGDELVLPGEQPGPDQIVASNTFGIAAEVQRAGGEPVDLGIARDDHADLATAIGRAREARADILVTLGGASVGDHDLVQEALRRSGMDLGFWKIAMRPGKPLMHGLLPGEAGSIRVLGLPGNPVSSMVCGRLFLVPLIRALCGDPHAAGDFTEPAILAAPLPANDRRQDYLRAALKPGMGVVPEVSAFGRQDSSMLSMLAAAHCLIVRAPHAPAAALGDPCRILRL